VADGNVYVGSEDYSVYCLDAYTGEKKWSYATRDAVESSPAIADGILYVGSDDSYIYAFAIGGSISETSMPQAPSSLAWTTVAFDAIASVIGAVLARGLRGFQLTAMPFFAWRFSLFQRYSS
jgi:outer membrane protein assembly factor BamB